MCKGSQCNITIVLGVLGVAASSAYGFTRQARRCWPMPPPALLNLLEHYAEPCISCRRVVCPSFRPSVRHTLALCQNDAC